MADVGKINGVAQGDINRLCGIDEANIGKVNGLNFSAGASYVTAGMEVHLVAADSSSYSGPGATSWNDISGNNRVVTLYNGASEPVAGDNFVLFDGVDDYGELTWQSGDYFYPGSPVATMPNNYSACWIAAFPEDGTTGFCTNLGMTHWGTRQQSGGKRCLFIRSLYWTQYLAWAYGSVPYFFYPSTPSVDFQYNTARGRNELYPDRFYHFAVTFDKNASGNDQLRFYINGQSYSAPSQSTSGWTSTDRPNSRGKSQYGTSSQVRLGPATWQIQRSANVDGSLGTHLPSSIKESLLYSTTLSPADVLQNYNAYISNYGAIN